MQDDPRKELLDDIADQADEPVDDGDEDDNLIDDEDEDNDEGDDQ
jgi:hypothetical protein